MLLETNSDTQDLRQQIKVWVDTADDNQLRRAAEQIKAINSVIETPDCPYPAVPASLVKPSDEQLARELKERRESGRPSISSKDAYEIVRSRLANV